MANPHELSQTVSLTNGHSYDIFLSFRGVDTRYNFTNHLHKALLDANIETFLDEVIAYGEDLRPELETAIRSSRASIVVFSENYASSRWCLNELVWILEQQKNSDHRIIPVFYHVNPADIKDLQGSFGDAFAKHRQKIEDERNPEIRSQLVSKMKLWREALVKVAGLKGHDVDDKK
uniref:disease resistance protein RPV1-like n=1 Tax=Erigeron canadensis TaxID=72917 RepID=UPI001CB90F41|nr:disease resistance protein RPV1-like [Erigeron canadensis]